MTTPTPRRWAEGLLRTMLAPRDRETVSGDLLEQYRDSVWLTRGQLHADLWYAGQVASFAWLRHVGWALAVSVLLVGRTALDWLVPTTDFALRAAAAIMAAVFSVIGAGALLTLLRGPGTMMAIAGSGGLEEAFNSHRLGTD